MLQDGPHFFLYIFERSLFGRLPSGGPFLGHLSPPTDGKGKRKEVGWCIWKRRRKKKIEERDGRREEEKVAGGGGG